jgi:glycosyl transferase family 2
MTLLVRNEADILADQLRLHYALGVDAVIVTDNASTDATPEILREFARDHELHIWPEPSNDFEQSAWVTRMARQAVELGADWVINADADEFHWPEVGTLKDVFAAVPERYGVLEMPVSHFVPTSDDPGAWHERLLLRECRSVKPSGRAHARNVAHRAHPEVVVHKGNHQISGAPLEELPGWRPVTVLHFPIRSYEQYEHKIAAGGKHFTGGHAIWVPGEKETGISRIYRDGRLRESYAAKRFDHAAAAEALRSGRLVLDDRLRRFLAGGAGPPKPPPAGGALAYPDDPPAVAELRVACAQAIYLAEHDPLRARLARLEQSLEGALARSAELKERGAALKGTNRELKERLGRKR